MRIMMIPTCVLTLSILAALLHGVTTLRLVDLKVPPYIIRGQPIRLECHYDLEGEALYSVKWFKNNQEFFRFLPEDDPPAQVFSRRGVYVDLPNSSDTAVVLRAVDENSSGEYRCEVSGEAPSFKTVMDEKTMVVVDLPDASGPQLDGLRPRYQIGELVAVNCSSARSRPAAQIFWFINQEPADEGFLHYYPILLDEDGLQTSMLGLEFRIRRKHLEKGDLKIKCLATIDTLYWRSNEQTVDVDRPHNSAVLESRGGAFPGASSSGTSLVKSSSIFSLQNGLLLQNKLTVIALSLFTLLMTHYHNYKCCHYLTTGTTTRTLFLFASVLLGISSNLLLTNSYQNAIASR